MKVDINCPALIIIFDSRHYVIEVIVINSYMGKELRLNPIHLILGEALKWKGNT